MSDTAAFFANKKKKKKAFKFNANLVDASTVTNSVHVLLSDPPASTTDQDPATVSSQAPHFGTKNGDNARDDDDQWDDAALPAPNVTRKVVPTQINPNEVLDMKSLDTKRTEQGDIAEKLRVEETKAQLSAAREGMEREAAKLKEEQEKKEQTAANSKSATASSPFGGGKWVSTRMREAAASSVPASRSGASQKLDVQNEELFPDLASADRILEQKEKQNQVMFKPPKKTPVGGGATWASKQPPKAASPPSSAKQLAVATEGLTIAPTPEPAPTQIEEATPTAISTPTASGTQDVASTMKPTVTAPVAAKSSPVSPSKDTGVKKTKKKKDLSTFKPKAAT